MINIKYFARLSESLNLKSETIAYSKANNTVESLIQHLIDRGEPWCSEFSSESKVLIAVNQELSDRQATLESGDEIAFFPPVTGG